MLRSCFEVKGLQKKHTGDALINLYSQVQPAGTVQEDNGSSVVPWAGSCAASSQVAVDWHQEENHRKALGQQLDSETQVVAFGGQEHCRVKVPLREKPQGACEESARIPENHDSWTVQRPDSKSLLVVDEGRILEAGNYILGSLERVKTSLHFGQDRCCRGPPRPERPQGGPGRRRAPPAAT